MKKSFKDMARQLRKLLRQTLEALLRILETAESSETTGIDMSQKRAEIDGQAAVLPQLEASTTPATASPEILKDAEKDGSALRLTPPPSFCWTGQREPMSYPKPCALRLKNCYVR